MEQKQFMNIKTEETIGIIGLGYVGLPLLINFGKSYKVLGFDSDEKKVEVINSGKSNINHIPSSDIQNLISNGPIATSDFAKIKLVDAIIICVPTPIRYELKNKPDLRFIEAAISEMAPLLESGNLVILESTVPVGTIDFIKTKLIEKGVDTSSIDIAYCPERVLPGNIIFEMVNYN